MSIRLLAIQQFAAALSAPIAVLGVPLTVIDDGDQPGERRYGARWGWAVVRVIAVSDVGVDDPTSESASATADALLSQIIAAADTIMSSPSGYIDAVEELGASIDYSELSSRKIAVISTYRVGYHHVSGDPNQN